MRDANVRHRCCRAEVKQSQRQRRRRSKRQAAGGEAYSLEPLLLANFASPTEGSGDIMLSAIGEAAMRLALRGGGEGTARA